MRKIYRNNLKNWGFGKEAPQSFCLERETIAERQGSREDKSFEEKSTSPKTDSSGCFGIIIATLSLFSGGCMSNSAFHLGEGQEIVQTLSVTKQKQRISLLQKKLENAERDLKSAQDEVEYLNRELHQSQLALIAKQIENYEIQIRKIQADPLRHVHSRAQEERVAPFLKEREMLQKMMESGPSPEAFEAQVVLDRILRMITELRDVEETSR